MLHSVACKAGRSVPFCHRHGSTSVHDVSRELSALQAFYLGQRTVPGPPEDLRPWLFELLTRWAARTRSCVITWG